MNAGIATIWALVWLVISVALVLAARRLGRGEPWATRVLIWSLVVVAFAEVTTTALVFSRGLRLSDVPGQSAYGWQPVAVALVAWGAGLWLSRDSAGRSRVPVGQGAQELG